MNNIVERNTDLKLRIYTAALLICLSLVPLSSQANPAPNEENCRMAITAGLEQLRRITPDMAKRDEEDRKKLLEVMERLVEKSRRQGLSECQIWAEMMRKAFNQ